MKRKTVLAVIAVLMLVLATCALVACNPRGVEEPPCDNVSRTTDAYFAGESDSFAVSVEKGRREKTFIADGKATDVEEFCQITVTPLKSNSDGVIAFLISGGEATLSGELSPSDQGEYTLAIDLDFVPETVTLTVGDKECEIELANILDGALTTADVINIAKEAFKDKIEQEAADGKAEREIYVKLITGDRTSYFYYVSFIGDGVDYWAMLVDPKTGEIVSKR